ncbi:peroxidase family protein [Singulisphaera sp. Ch08]|uniref:Peroxidase family protein n=1 Tax=Singulisphaera sp. Ch08 TaxID=3120278 RepID=A0AAU7CIG9_9BACT
MASTKASSNTAKSIQVPLISHPLNPAARRSKDRDGLINRIESYVLTHFGPIWALIQAVPPLRRRTNRWLINRAIYKTKTRPYPFSTMSDFTSWDSLTDRSYSDRHLPSAELPGGPLPPIEEVQALFQRRGETTLSPKSSLLFSYFAQWFTDGFLRTDRVDPLKNTSNHDVDLSPLYGLSRRITPLLRAKTGGRLKSQQINGEEYPHYYYRDGRPADEFIAEWGELPIIVPDWLEQFPDRKATLFAFGGERANVQIGYVMLNTLFLREHNRICGVLSHEHPDWNDERLFQTTRNITIVLLIKLVIEEYINHITPYHFKFQVNPPIGGKESWYRTNWMTVEFNLLYRWHGLIPDKVVIGDQMLPMEQTLFNNPIVTSIGLGPLFDAASRQPAGEIGLFNTPISLMETEKASIQHGRLVGLASYNDYRERVSYPRVTRFDQITGDPERQRALERLYGHVDRVEFYVGLFAEDVRPNAAVAALIGRLVGIDAFSQALTNPLLAENVYNEKTFTSTGLSIIESTRSLSEVLQRNIPPSKTMYAASLTRLDWRRIPSNF